LERVYKGGRREKDKGERGRRDDISLFSICVFPDRNDGGERGRQGCRLLVVISR
jgi:hypothetical protein